MTDSSINWIANNLRKSRINAGYETAKLFADAHNIPVTTYRQHESGKRNLSFKIAAKYAELLNVSILDLLPNTLFDLSSNTNILLMLEIFKEYLDHVHKINISSSDAINFIQELYQNLLVSDMDKSTRKQIINLAISSLIAGTNSQHNPQSIVK